MAVRTLCGESFVNTVGQQANSATQRGRTHGSAPLYFLCMEVGGVQFGMFISAAWLLWGMILADVSVLNFEWKVSHHEFPVSY